MLKKLTHREYENIIHIAGREYRTRYSLNCLLCLEMTYKPLSEILTVPFSQWSAEDIIQLAHAAMCDLPKNRKAVNRRQFNFVRPDLEQLGKMIRPEDLPKLTLELIDAVTDSLPDSSRESGPERVTNEEDLYALAVDVVKIPERDFWESNYKELSNRLDHYAVAKGYKEAPLMIQQFEE